MPRFHNIDGIDVQFSEAEEMRRDEEEARSAIEAAERENRDATLDSLHARLQDGTLNLEEINLMLALEREP